MSTSACMYRYLLLHIRFIFYLVNFLVVLSTNMLQLFLCFEKKNINFATIDICIPTRGIRDQVEP